MKRFLRIFPLLLVGMFFFPCCQKMQPKNSDDSVAFMLMLNSDNVDIRGLTTVTGNVWAQEALSYGIRIGELWGGKNLT